MSILQHPGQWLMRKFGKQNDAIGAARRARAELERGHWEQAILYAELAIAADATLPDGYRLLGLARRRLGQTEPARRAYETAVRLAPEDAWTQASLGDCLRELYDFPAAETHYRRALELREPDADTLQKLAEVVKQQDRLDEADELIRQASTLAPDDPNVLSQLGDLYRMRGDYTRAIDTLRRAVESNPALPGAQYALALSLAAQQRWDEALRAIDKAQRLVPDNAEFEKLARTIRWNRDGGNSATVQGSTDNK